ncbi:DoxX family protein [Thalassorhabdomicrobium marinisediminis]|uniref:DoxX family protein n=1 Tax=Thalassorhabdomicrobium marinisediminis TaxID=2170577 RepID=UPI00248FDC23|nr:DoxX family protein [Thalassorhabdomicrobium marinisediminis]
MTFETNTNVGATLARLSLGVILLAHGLLKLFVFTLPGTVAFFDSLGYPAIIAYLTVFAEVAGGAALIAGLYSRLVAVLSLPVLIGSFWVHAGNGWLFSNEGGGWEFPALLVALAVIVAIQGGGAFALRRLPVVDGFVPQALKA